MKKKKSPILYVYFGCMLLVLIYLLTANSLVLKYFNNNGILCQINFSEISSNTTPKFTAKASYSSDVFETVYIQGTAYCDSGDESDREINVVLKDVYSDDAYMCYNKGQQYGNTKRAIYCRFSTINLPVGIYEIYYNVVDNEDFYGVVSTNLFFEKTNDDFFQISFPQ